MTTPVAKRIPHGIPVDFRRIKDESRPKNTDALPKPRPAYSENGAGGPRPQLSVTGAHADGVPMRVPVDYTYAESYGLAEVGYLFEVGKIVLLAAGGACRIEQLKPGMQFQLKQGGFGTVTKVASPIPWPVLNPVPDKNGNVARRILGTIKHVGYVVVDVVVGGQAITTTPDHRFRLSNGEWVPAGQLRRGDALVADDKRSVAVESVSAPRRGCVELYNLEVEKDHNFFVQGKPTHGNPVAGINVHNGYDYINLPVEAPAVSIPPALLEYARTHPLPNYLDTSTFGQTAFPDLVDWWAPAKAAVKQLQDLKKDLQKGLDLELLYPSIERLKVVDEFRHNIHLIERVINEIQDAINKKKRPDPLVLSGINAKDAKFYNDWMRIAFLTGIDIDGRAALSTGETALTILPFIGEMTIPAVAGRTLIYQGWWNFGQYAGGKMSGGQAVENTATQVSVNIVATGFGQYVVAPALKLTFNYIYTSPVEEGIFISGEAHKPVTGSMWYEWYAVQSGPENVNWSRLPTFTGPKSAGGTGTIGVLRIYSGEFDVISGRVGPGSLMSGNGFDIVSRMHAEGHATAIMRILDDQEGILFINNPEICNSCFQNLSRMIPPGGRLIVVLPNGTSVIFQGNLP